MVEVKREGRGPRSRVGWPGPLGVASQGWSGSAKPGDHGVGEAGAKS